jgi:hypothetical protein
MSGPSSNNGQSGQVGSGETTQNICNSGYLSSGNPLQERFCSRCEKMRPVLHFNRSNGGYKAWCIDCERIWQTHKINSGKEYSFTEIVRTIGGSMDTLRRMREDGRLIVISTRPSHVSGQRLIEAIQNRRMP